MRRRPTSRSPRPLARPPARPLAHLLRARFCRLVAAAVCVLVAAAAVAAAAVRINAAASRANMRRFHRQIVSPVRIDDTRLRTILK